MSVLDFSQMAAEAEENNKFPTLESGSYEFEVTDAVLGNSKSSGNPMITVTLQEVESKIKVNEYLTLTSKAFFKVVQFTKNAGVKLPEGKIDIESDEFDDWVHDLIGLTVYATVKTEPAVDNKTKKPILTDDGEQIIRTNVTGYVSKDKVGKGKKRNTRKL